MSTGAEASDVVDVDEEALEYVCPACGDTEVSPAAALGCCQVDPSEVSLEDVSETTVEKARERRLTAADLRRGHTPSTGPDVDDAASASDEEAENDEDRPVASVDTEHVPESINHAPIWFLWDTREKVVLAPWATGNLYPAPWAGHMEDDDDVEFDDRLEVTYDRASQVAEFPLRDLLDAYPHPEADDVEVILPTIVLPHEYRADVLDSPRGLPLAYIDFDDVRDPETGEITEEVQRILDRLDSYTEVSRSGEGLHTLVWGRLPGNMGKLMADLDGAGQIEIYDGGRVLGATWRHVEDTPLTITEADSTINSLVHAYGDEDDDEAAADRSSTGGSGTTSPRGGGSTSTNDYYDLDLSPVVSTGPFGTHGDGVQGPHPAHGGTSSADENSKNFKVDGDTWHCFAHDSKGGTLHLIATLEATNSRRVCGKCPGLSGVPLLRACVAARDKYTNGTLDDADPPVAALAAMAGLMWPDKYHAPAFDDLGESDREMARLAYDSITLEKLESKIEERG